MPLLAGVVASGFLAFGASTASAVVQIDPSGPAGKQYALPLDSVRGEVAGNPAAGVPGARTQAPLFGQGIRPVGSAESADNSGADGGRAGRENGPGGTDKSGDAANRKGNNGVVTNPNVTELINGTGGGTSTTLEKILLFGGMALVGLTAGLIGRQTL